MGLFVWGERERENRLYPGDVMWDCGVSAGLTPVCGRGVGQGWGQRLKLFFSFKLNLWNKHWCTEEFVNTLYCSNVFKRFNISLIRNLDGHDVNLGSTLPL